MSLAITSSDLINPATGTILIKGTASKCELVDITIAPPTATVTGVPVSGTSFESEISIGGPMTCGQHLRASVTCRYKQNICSTPFPIVATCSCSQTVALEVRNAAGVVVNPDSDAAECVPDGTYSVKATTTPAAPGQTYWWSVNSVLQTTAAEPQPATAFSVPLDCKGDKMVSVSVSQAGCIPPSLSAAVNLDACECGTCGNGAAEESDKCGKTVKKGCCSKDCACETDNDDDDLPPRKDPCDGPLGWWKCSNFDWPPWLCVLFAALLVAATSAVVVALTNAPQIGGAGTNWATGAALAAFTFLLGLYIAACGCKIWIIIGIGIGIGVVAALVIAYYRGQLLNPWFYIALVVAVLLVISEASLVLEAKGDRCTQATNYGVRSTTTISRRATSWGITTASVLDGRKNVAG